MLDVGATESGPKSRNRFWRPAGTFGALAIVLGVAFLPLLFNNVSRYDDEGFFLLVNKQFLQHGSLYVHTSGVYGPFYFSFLGLTFRLIGQDPTLFSGRLIVLILTALTAAMFAAAVWRVTRSLLFGVLCQVATFCTLILVAGNEPLHPGSMIAFLLSVLVYALASFSVDQRNRLLVIAGACAGAMAMTKINVGVLAIAGLAVALIVGNAVYPRWFRFIVAAGGIAVPFVLMLQRLDGVGIARFAFLVGLSTLGACMVMSADPISLAPRTLFATAAGALGAMFVSMLWPLFSGTGLGDLFDAVFLRPLDQVDLRTNLPEVDVQWIPILLAGLAVVVVATQRDRFDAFMPPRSPARYLILGGAGLWVFGMGVSTFGSWLPAIVLLPALALFADVSPATRLALRLMTPVVILQVLHSYPVSGSRLGWSTVAVFVPCSIAMAAGLTGIAMWRECSRTLRGLAIGSLCVVVSLTGGLWPLSVWSDYLDLTPLDLPGSRLVRVHADVASELRLLTRIVEQRCDTFLSVPGLNSLYLYSGIPAPSGQLARTPGTLTDSEELDFVKSLRRREREGERVCVVRDLNNAGDSDAYAVGGSETQRPFGRFIRNYRRSVALVGGKFVTGTLRPLPRYSISIKGRPVAPKPRVRKREQTD